MSSMPQDPGSNNSRCHLQVMAMQAMDGRAAAQLLLLCEHVWQEGATKLPRATYRLLHERPEAAPEGVPLILQAKSLRWDQNMHISCTLTPCVPCMLSSSLLLSA